MHYFWVIPVFAIVAVLTWVLYLVVARGLPKISNRSVEDALAEDREADANAKTDSAIGS